jgi:hypothetical protein
MMHYPQAFILPPPYRGLFDYGTMPLISSGTGRLIVNSGKPNNAEA